MQNRVIIMGVAGCGKSSVGAALSDALGAAYEDGDDLHPQTNIDKMSAGIALNDADRAPWLDQIGARLGAADHPLMIGCSALKRIYRDRIRATAGGPVFFLHLMGARRVIEGRMSARAGHFMPVSLLDSQFADLEPLGRDEIGAAVDIDQPLEAVTREAAAALAQGRAG
jgi:carbohydrate kinase (thermoresistant glucokinase family)